MVAASSCRSCVFRRRVSGEFDFFSVSVALGGLFCSLCELVSSGAEQTLSLSLLLQEIKEKDIVSRAVNTLKRFEGQI